jgi:hypothetical protein
VSCFQASSRPRTAGISSRIDATDVTTPRARVHFGNAACSRPRYPPRSRATCSKPGGRTHAPATRERC